MTYKEREEKKNSCCYFIIIFSFNPASFLVAIYIFIVVKQKYMNLCTERFLYRHKYICFIKKKRN